MCIQVKASYMHSLWAMDKERTSVDTVITDLSLLRLINIETFVCSDSMVRWTAGLLSALTQLVRTWSRRKGTAVPAV